MKLSASWRGWLVTSRTGTWEVSTIHPAIQQFVSEIETALNAGLFYLAIAVALSIPDVCSCLEADPDKIWATPEKYNTWFETYLNSTFTNFTSDDCYRLRCGVVHQGNFGHPKSRYDLLIFLAPNSSFRMKGDILVTIATGVKFGDVEGKVLQIEATWFCQQFVASAREWAKIKSADVNVQRNLPNLVRFRSNGLPPYMVGVPVIA